MPSPAASASASSRRRLSVALALSLAAAAGIALLASPSGAGAAPAARRPIRDTDIFRFVWVADPQISPDGRRVAFVRVTVDAQREGYDTAIWVVPADGSAPPRALTSGRHDSAPRWSPDGRRLAFLRVEDKGDDKGKDGGKGEAQLYLLALDGGEARALTSLVGGAGSPVWSPDGRRIAFVNGANEKDLEKAERGREPEENAGDAKPVAKLRNGEDDDAGHESDVRVITRAVYRQNGQGYLDAARPPHLWVVALPASDGAPPPRPVQVTRGRLPEQSPLWSPDGNLLYFISRRVEDIAFERELRDLYAVPSGGGEPRLVLSFNGEMGEPRLSRDGRRIAWTESLNAEPERSYDESDLLVAETAPGGSGATARNLTSAFDGDLGSGLAGDQHPPRGSGGGATKAPVWSADGRSLYAVAAVRGRANLLRFDATPGAASSRPEPVTTGDHEVMEYSAAADASRFALTLSTPTEIGDLFVLDVESHRDHRLRQLTRFNDELFAGLDLTPPEEIVYKSFDGRPIEAWVQKPPGFDPQKKYPLILNIHGGPHSAYGYTFDHEFQWMAAKGYVVLYPNPRGSSTYGEEFGNVIQYRYPGDDAKDLLAGIDELVQRGYVDEKHLGVTGGSGGGVLTNWIIGHDDRFAAAASQRSIADWSAFWYDADFSLFTPGWFKGAPWEDPADFRARSPITYVANVKTPLMLIEGEADYRTPPASGGEQMFRALKYLKRPVVMVRFPGETHELSRSGRPWHRVERLRHIVAWFDKYLQGKPVQGYGEP